MMNSDTAKGEFEVAMDVIDSFKLALQSNDPDPIQMVTDYVINKYGDD